MKNVYIYTGLCVLVALLGTLAIVPRAKVETQSFDELCNECGYDKFTAKTSILSIESSANLYVYECGRNNFMLTNGVNKILDCDIRNEKR